MPATKNGRAVKGAQRRVLTVDGHAPLRPGQEVPVQPVQVLGLRDRAAEGVHEHGHRAVGLQQRAQEPLQEGDELLVLLGLAHL